MLVQFETIDGAARSVSAIIQAKIIPATLEFMEAATINCIRGTSIFPLLSHCQAILIIEVDGELALLDKQMQRIKEAFDPNNILNPGKIFLESYPDRPATNEHPWYNGQEQKA
ncbi:MAG: FAD-linked oxidase C-terminal domain-containing protein [Pseudomonadota bacterium]